MPPIWPTVRRPAKRGASLDRKKEDDPVFYDPVPSTPLEALTHLLRALAGLPADRAY